MTTQYVITMNDFPEEVCAAGTTQEQAVERAELIKMAYMIENPEVPAFRLHVRARETRVWKP